MASRGKRILIGCGLGCLGLLLLSVAGCIGFTVWIRQPGELLDAGRLVGGDTTAHVEWTLRLEDPGTGEVIEHILERMQTVQQDPDTELPPFLEGILLQQQSRRNRKQLLLFLPAVVAWTVQPGESIEADRHLFTVSLQRVGNRLRLADWIIGLAFSMDSDNETVNHRGERILTLGRRRDEEPPHLFLRGNDIFIASDLESARYAVDRLVELEATGSEGEIHSLLAEIPAKSSLRGALTNENGELLRVLDTLQGLDSPDAPLDGIAAAASAVRLRGGFTEDAGFEGEIEVWARNGEWPAEIVSRIGPELDERLEQAGVPILVESSAAQGRLMLHFRIDDFPAALEAFLSDL